MIRSGHAVISVDDLAGSPLVLDYPVKAAGHEHPLSRLVRSKRVNGLVDQLVAIMTRARKPASGELGTLTLVLAPRVSRAGRRPSRSSSERRAA